MNYQEKLANAKSIYQRGLLKVASELMPEEQKFPPESFVKIADDLRSSMNHFTKGVYAQVKYTYAHAYGGNDIDSYSLLVRHSKDDWSSSAWYGEHQLIAVTDEKIILELQEEIEKQNV